jgi:hypothetical protein
MCGRSRIRCSDRGADAKQHSHSHCESQSRQERQAVMGMRAQRPFGMALLSHSRSLFTPRQFAERAFNGTNSHIFRGKTARFSAFSERELEFEMQLRLNRLRSPKEGPARARTVSP